MDKKIIQSISEYLDDNLTLGKKQNLEMLIRSDPEVKAEFEEQKNIVNALNVFMRRKKKADRTIRKETMERMKDSYNRNKIIK